MSYLVSELIRKKRDGGELLPAEIQFLVKGFAEGSIPDYQITAWLMAAFLKGLNAEETFQLTCEMKNSGRTLNWRALSANFRDEVFVDKHSTGGIGDKVSVVLAPLAASLGLKVPMMSGRGLGHTGGTVDKLESIPGFSLFPDEAQMVKLLDEVGVCMMAQAKDLCPADRKLYALRDVTGTVESISLITASIFSKKWAEGIDAIVFDVKSGEAAFMQNEADAQALALSLKKTAERAGLKASSVRTRMEEPLGVMIGNALEIQESIWILEDEYPSERARKIAAPLRQLCLELTAEMAVLSGRYASFAEALKVCEAHLQQKKALKVFEHMLEKQGAKAHWRETIFAPVQRLPLSSPTAGYIAKIHSRNMGVAGLKIAVGRQKTDDIIDHAVGFEMNVAVGDTVAPGEILLWAHVRNAEQLARVQKDLLACLVITEKPAPAARPLVLERI